MKAHDQRADLVPVDWATTADASREMLDVASVVIALRRRQFGRVGDAPVIVFLEDEAASILGQSNRGKVGTVAKFVAPLAFPVRQAVVWTIGDPRPLLDQTVMAVSRIPGHELPSSEPRLLIVLDYRAAGQASAPSVADRLINMVRTGSDVEVHFEIRDLDGDWPIIDGENVARVLEALVALRRGEDVGWDLTPDVEPRLADVVRRITSACYGDWPAEEQERALDALRPADGELPR